jgi:tetratricopeptide (TPR) repeat protein
MRLDDDRVRAIAQALKALNGGAIEEAAEIGRALVQRWPEDASACQVMATIALRRKGPAEAERWALLSLAARPDHYVTLILAAQAAQAMGHLPTALQRFRRAGELDPARPEAAFGVGEMLIQHSPSDAGPIIDDLLSRFPDRTADLVQIGGVLEKSGQAECASRVYGTVVKVQPSAKLYVRLGSTLHSLGRRDQALACYHQALSLDGESFEAWFKLGLVLQDGRRPDRAAEAYLQALALRPDLAEAEVNLGVALQDLGELSAAKQAYGRAIGLMPAAFGRIAQALTTAPKGELWMDLGALRAHLSELGRLSR